MKSKKTTIDSLMKTSCTDAKKGSKSPSKEEVLDLLKLIGWTRDKIRKVRQRELAPYGLNPDKGAVLQVIQNLGGSARTDDIAREIIRERHSVHELLRRMEKSGLLREVEGTHRKNGVCFELTKQGIAAYHHVTKRDLQSQLFSSVSEIEREHLVKSLYELYSAACRVLGEKSLPLRVKTSSR